MNERQPLRANRASKSWHRTCMVRTRPVARTRGAVGWLRVLNLEGAGRILGASWGRRGGATRFSG